MKKVISIILCTLVLMSVFVVNASAQESSEESKAQLVDVPSGYNLLEFSELYSNGKLSVAQNDSAATVTNDEKNGGVIISGKPSEISKLSLELTDEIDLGSYTAGRLVLNAIHEVKYGSSVKIRFDNDDTKTASVDAVKQSRSGSWIGEKNKCSDISTLNLSGKHKLSLNLKFNDDVADKKTNVMLKNMLFIAYSIPVVDVNIDESLGTIDAMNSDKKHQTECYGNMSISIPEDYKSEYSDEKLESATYELDYIRGRGNSTWGTSKNPYKVKLKKKASLLGMDANKHWGLIANYYDYSLLRNKYTYWLGAKMGMEFTPKCVFVDVVMNGSYLGSYCLSELVRVDETRVNIDDLEDTPEVTDGEALTGGYLINLDASKNAALIETDRGNRYTVESPDFNENFVEAQYNYIKDYLNKTEDAIYSDNLCDSDGKPYSDYIDIDAMIDYYIVQATSDNSDAFGTGSTYLYKKRSGKLFWGPLWDFDYVAWWATRFNEDIEFYGYGLENYPWFREIFENDSVFREKFISRMKEFDEVIRQSAQGGGQVDAYAKEVYLSQYANHLICPSMADEYIDESEDNFVVSYDNEIARFKKALIAKADWQDNNTSSILSENSNKVFEFVVDGKTIGTLNSESVNSYDFYIDSPTKKNYVFVNWYTNVESIGEVSIDDYLNKYIYDDYTNDTVTFYAKWKENKMLNKTSVKLNAGKTTTLKINLGKVSKWFSSNPKVATVTNGKVTALKKGTANIYAILSGNSYLTCKVTVNNSPTLKVSNKTFNAKKTYSVKKGNYLKVKITGKASFVKNVYATTNKKIAKVTSKNTASTVKIKALKKGKATVTVKVNGVAYKIKVKVK